MHTSLLKTLARSREISNNPTFLSIVRVDTVCIVIPAKQWLSVALYRKGMARSGEASRWCCVVKRGGVVHGYSLANCSTVTARQRYVTSSKGRAWCCSVLLRSATVSRSIVTLGEAEVL